MFWKVFSLFSCLVLYTTSEPIRDRNHYKADIVLLKGLLDNVKTNQINCSNSFIQMINLTHERNVHETVQETFCQISKALNKCNCTGTDMQQLRNLLDKMKGNDSCQLPESSSEITMVRFLANLGSYIDSLNTLPPN